MLIHPSSGACDLFVELFHGLYCSGTMCVGVTLVHPFSGACDLFVELFHGLYCSGTMCVGVTLWFGCGGMVSGCRLKQCKSQAPEVGCINIRNMLSIK